MGILSFLKAPKTIDKMLGAVINAGDVLVYTPEEKAEMKKQMAQIHLKHIELTAGENNETSVARRWLATLITVPFLILTVGSAIFHAVGMTDVAEHWQALAMEDYSTLVMMTAAFYFGNHALKSLKG